MRTSLVALAAASMALTLTPRIFMAPTAQIETLRTQQQELQDASTAIVASADEAGRDLTDDEVEKIDANAAEIEKLGKQIRARESVTVVAASAGRKTAPETREAGTKPGTVAARARVDDPRGGFKSFGEFAACVRVGSIAGNQPDNRLLNAATTFGGEGSGADGGFAVPGTFRTEIWEKVMGEENLLNRCAQLVTGGNSITIPKDETTPWQTTGGILAFWESEAGTPAASKPQLVMTNIRLAKLMALVPISDELLEDAPGLESWLTAKAPAKMAAKINTAIIAGTGVGQPLGILNAPAKVQVAKESSQGSGTLVFKNIEKMWASMYAPCRRNAIWLINQDVEPQLNGLAFDPNATSKVPVYLPANGLSEGPYATLMGRPVVPLEACSTIGTEGDIILADMEQYWAITKGQSVRQDVSMHLYFDQALLAYRFIFRLNGQPAWSTAITPQNGTLTRGCFMTLQAR